MRESSSCLTISAEASAKTQAVLCIGVATIARELSLPLGDVRGALALLLLPVLAPSLLDRLDLHVVLHVAAPVPEADEQVNFLREPRTEKSQSLEGVMQVC